MSQQCYDLQKSLKGLSARQWFLLQRRLQKRLKDLRNLEVVALEANVSMATINNFVDGVTFAVRPLTIAKILIATGDVWMIGSGKRSRVEPDSVPVSLSTSSRQPYQRRRSRDELRMKLYPHRYNPVRLRAMTKQDR